MSCSALHHIEVCVSDENKLMQMLINGFGFCIIGERTTRTANQWVLRSGMSFFVITKRKCFNASGSKQNNVLNELINSVGITNAEPKKMLHNTECNRDSKHTLNYVVYNERLPTDSLNGKNMLDHTEGSSEHWTVFCCRNESVHIRDSVFNISFVVKDVDNIVRRIRDTHTNTILREPCSLSDEEGEVRYAIVSSPCGNIVHTLVDKRNYKGIFLPGYNLICNNSANICHFSTQGYSADLPGHPNNMGNFYSKHILRACSSSDNISCPLTTSVDHVTYVCRPLESQALIAWYEQCFGMKRFMTNRQEDEKEGFVLHDDVGLRLKAMEYWRCAETGVASPAATSGCASLKLVLAEPLPDVASSHVDSFLREHDGPGVQHIGLLSDTILETVEWMTKQGVRFRKPPPTYYDECGKLSEISAAGYQDKVLKFQELGILLDTEVDPSDKNADRYLLQIFTEPLFNQDTFFLEVIQRLGAVGFGVGNITALARSIIRYKELKFKI